MDAADGRVKARFGERASEVFDLDGTGVLRAVAPLDDVERMRARVGGFASRVVGAESEMISAKADNDSSKSRSSLIPCRKNLFI